MSKPITRFRRVRAAITGRPDPELKIFRAATEALLARAEDRIAEMRDLLGISQNDLTSSRSTLAAAHGALAAAHGELGSSRDALAAAHGELASSRGALAAAHVELASSRGALAAAHGALASSRAELAKAQAVPAASLAALTDQERVANDLSSDGTKDNAFWPAMRESYLQLMQATLVGTIYEDAPLESMRGASTYDASIRAHGWDWPSKAFTMVGSKRLRNFRDVIEAVIEGNIPGDIIETGVWRGGACIFARAVLRAYEVSDRRIILADSFEGLPPPSADQYPADAGSTFHSYADLAVSLEEVQGNFRKFELLDDQVVFLKGWFKDTMPHVPCERLAVIRLDGDMYESTIVVLDNLFDRLSAGGWVIVDDYEVVPACKAAITDFLARRNLSPTLHPIDGVGVFFQKA